MRGPNERDDRDEEGFRARSAPGAAGATISAHAARRLGTSRIERFELDELPDGERTITRDVPRSTVGHLDERGLARAETRGRLGPLRTEGRARSARAHPALRHHRRRTRHGSVIRPDLRDEHGVPVMGGLLCPRLFGPVHDYECQCGALEGLRHRGTRCRECGVEILRSSVRRRRFAHVPLAAPVLHPLAFDLVATLLAVSSARLHAVLGYETTLAGDEPATGASLTTTGAPAIAAALTTLDLAALCREDGARGAHARALVAAGRRPESLVVEAWPVLPADLRPSNPKSRTITEALNDLYVRLVNRNQRLARLRELNAPEIILRNEACMLQRAVDALVENGPTRARLARAASQAERDPLVDRFARLVLGLPS